jgi:mannonate dehydratase
MRQAWAINNCTDEVLRTSAQFGVKDIIVYSGPGSNVIPGTNTPLHEGKRPGFWDYRQLVRRAKSFGLNIEGIEGGFSLRPEYSDIIFGGPRRDELIESAIEEVRSMARAGIRIWGYQWMPVSVWRTDPVRVRGGAYGTAYDHDLAKDEPPFYDEEKDEEEMWKNLEYWIKAITPVAEEEGIRCGIHPDDPPVESRGGVPGLLRSFAAYKRLMDIYPSDYNAIEFCQGTFSEMKDDIYEMVDYFARRNKILYVHFRNVNAKVPKFNEEYINTGYVDMKKIVRIYRDAGYKGTFMDDHCPVMTDDTEFPGNVGGYRARLFAQGYIQGLLESVDKEQAYGGPVGAG